MRRLFSIVLLAPCFACVTAPKTPDSGAIVAAPRVTGIGGVFFKSSDPKKLGEWYRDHLGIPVQPWNGAKFDWREASHPEVRGSTAWSLFSKDSHHFEPTAAPFMINYRVADLAAVLEALRNEGCTVDPRTEASEYGKFGWVMDPEGNRIELWEPPPVAR
jgi:predicted enzyme related to lactoylglutathione lyase